MHVGLDRCPGYLRRFQICPEVGPPTYFTVVNIVSHPEGASILNSNVVPS